LELSQCRRRNPTAGRCEDRTRELLRKYRGDTEVDALNEGLALLVQELMEAEVKEKTPGRAVRANEEPANVPQRVPPEAVGHPGRVSAAAAPQGPARELLPGVG